MSFVNRNQRFSTPAALAAWLTAQPRPTWGAIGSTYHNTYRPDEAMWGGHASMEQMQHTYVGTGWSTGPHFFLAAGTNFNGIYMMCPPTMEAIHGVTCNTDHFGIEVVGNFDTRPMSGAQMELLLGVCVVLHRWAGIGPELNAHRDCVARTCPGQKAYEQKPFLRAELARRLALPAPDPWAAWGTAHPLPVEQRTFGIPRAWLPARARLKAAISAPIYTGAHIVQLFQGGAIHFDTRSNTPTLVEFPREY